LHQQGGVQRTRSRRFSMELTKKSSSRSSNHGWRGLSEWSSIKGTYDNKWTRNITGFLTIRRKRDRSRNYEPPLYSTFASIKARSFFKIQFGQMEVYKTSAWRLEEYGEYAYFPNTPYDLFNPNICEIQVGLLMLDSIWPSVEMWRGECLYS
jgi:hypothetical protein